jgi:hypothetical protein
MHFEWSGWKFGNPKCYDSKAPEKKNPNRMPWNGAKSVEDRAIMHDGDNSSFWNEFMKYNVPLIS